MSETNRPVVVVKHVEGEDVEKHINILGVKQKRRSARNSCKISADFLNDVQPIKKKNAPAGKESQEEPNAPSDPASLVAETYQMLSGEMQDAKNQFSGSAVYGFKTPKRSKQMSKFATESARKIRTIQKSAAKENEAPAMPTCEDKSSPSKNLRSIKKFSVQEMNAGADDSDTTDNEETEDDDDLEEGVNTKKKQQGGRAKSVSFAAEAAKAFETNTSAKRIDLPSETELYFEAHKGGQKLGESTSDRTLGKLKLPRMDRDKMDSILSSHQDSKMSKGKKESTISKESIRIENSRQKLIQEHMRCFRKWMFYLSNGFNILLYGLGSKRNLMHDFCSRMLENYTKIIINGYFPSLTLKSILSSICEEAMQKTTVSANLQEQVDKICNRFSNTTEDRDQDHLFLIIHNIDGMPLRNNKTQGVLSQLASSDRIHVVASVDHINASLVWDQSKLCRYKWLWFDVTTFEPYTDETSYEDSLMLLTSGTGIGGSLALSGLVHVARSLTPNARGIFKLLAEFQIESSKENTAGYYIGLSFSDLYQKCREKFLVNSELTLRTQLTEFLDHKLVQIKKGGDGGEYLSIPLENSTLQEYLDQAEK